MQQPASLGGSNALGGAILGKRGRCSLGVGGEDACFAMQLVYRWGTEVEDNSPGGCSTNISVFIMQFYTLCVHNAVGFNIKARPLPEFSFK